MHDHAVTERKVGGMPFAAEVALANARCARMLRHASRCNCGSGKTNPGCTFDDTERLGSHILAEHAATARADMNKYRTNRTWTYSGGRG